MFRRELIYLFDKIIAYKNEKPISIFNSLVLLLNLKENNLKKDFKIADKKLTIQTINERMNLFEKLLILHEWNQW